MASTEVGGVHVAFSAGVARFRRDMKKASKELRKFDEDAKKLSKTADKLERAGGKLTRSLTLPLVAAGAAAVKFASDAEESANKFDVVMGDSAASVRQELEELTATIPATRAQLEEMAGGLQDLLVPMGVARSEAAGMSADMVKLAGDLGSFNNVAPTQVLEAMKSALAGASEPMRRFGVDTREAALDAIALKHGLVEAGQEMDSAARAQAVMIAIQKDSTDAIGDAARTVDSAANSFKFLKRDVRELAEQIGVHLVPMARDLASTASEWLNKFGELDKSTQKLIVSTAGVAAALGPVVFMAGKAIRAYIAMRKAILGVRAASLSLIGVFGGAAAAAGLIFLVGRLTGQWDDLSSAVTTARDRLGKAAKTVGNEVNRDMQALAIILERVRDALEDINELIPQVDFGELSSEGFKGAFTQGTGIGGISELREAWEFLRDKIIEADEKAKEAQRTFNLFGQEARKTFDAAMLFAGGAESAAADTEELSDAVDDASVSLDGLRMSLGEVQKMLDTQDVDRMVDAFEEWEKGIEDVNSLNTELVDGTVDVGGQLEKATDDTHDLARELERAARTGIDFARTLGLIGDSAAATLNSVANLGSGIDDLIGAIGSGGIGGIIGAGTSILGAVGGIVSGLFGGGGPSEEEVARQRALEQQRKEAQRRFEQIQQLNREFEVTLALLAQSSDKLQEIANSLGEQGLLTPFRELAEALQTPEFDPTQIAEKFKEMMDRLGQQVGGLGVDVDRLAGQMGGLGDIAREFAGPTIDQFKAQMEALGLNFLDVLNLAKQFGLQVDELIQILVTGQGDTKIATAQMEALLEAIGLIPDAALEAQRALRAMRDAMRDARDDIERFGVDDPVEQIRLLANALGPLAEPGGPLGALISSLATGDITETPQTFIDQINALITQLQAPGAQLGLVPEAEEGALIDQLIGIIRLIRDVAEREARARLPSRPTTGRAPTSPAPAPEPVTVSRPDFIRRAVVTEAQASEILAGNRTRNVRLVQIRDLMVTQNAILGALPTSIRKNVNVSLAQQASLQQTAN